MRFTPGLPNLSNHGVTNVVQPSAVVTSRGAGSRIDFGAILTEQAALTNDAQAKSVQCKPKIASRNSSFVEDAPESFQSRLSAAPRLPLETPDQETVAPPAKASGVGETDPSGEPDTSYSHSTSLAFNSAPDAKSGIPASFKSPAESSFAATSFPAHSAKLTDPNKARKPSEPAKTEAQPSQNLLPESKDLKPSSTSVYLLNPDQQQQEVINTSPVIGLSSESTAGNAPSSIVSTRTAASSTELSDKAQALTEPASSSGKLAADSPSEILPPAGEAFSDVIGESASPSQPDRAPVPHLAEPLNHESKQDSDKEIHLGRNPQITARIADSTSLRGSISPGALGSVEINPSPGPLNASPSLLAVTVTAQTAETNPYQRLDQGVPAYAATFHAGSNHVAVGVSDPAMGWLEVKTQSSSGQISASLVTSSSETHASLATQLPSLIQYLADHEVKVSHIGVEHHPAGASGDRGTSSRQNSPDDGQGQANRAVSIPGVELKFSRSPSGWDQDFEASPLSYISIRA